MEVATFQLMSHIQKHKPVLKKLKVAKLVINTYQNLTFQAVEIAPYI